MFERYNEGARRVIFFARYEASQYGSPDIETEHILLGLLRQDKALTNRLLRQDSVESIRKQIDSKSEKREKVSTSVDLPLSNECKRVLAYAAEEAERLGHRHIGTEHLLLGLLREGRCFAAQILQERGVELGAARTELGSPEPTSIIERRNRPRVEMVDSHGNILSSLPWGPWVAIPRTGEYLKLKIRDSTTEFLVDKITYQYEDELRKIVIVLKVADPSHGATEK